VRLRQAQLDPRARALALLDVFTMLFAALASDRERQRPKALRCDRIAAIGATGIKTGIQPPQSFRDLLEKMTSDLNLCVHQLVFENDFRVSTFDTSAFLPECVSACGKQIVMNLI
jgi:hypothetical protein